jgi:hypothetical protein
MENKLLKKIEDSITVFLENCKKQASNTKEAAEVIERYIKEGEITDEDEEILKTQLVDSLKIIGVVIPFVLIPGASILLPFLIKVAEKNDIELMPTAFQDEKKEKVKRLPKRKSMFNWNKTKTNENKN